MKRMIASLGLAAFSAMLVVGCATTPGSSQMASSEIESEMQIKTVQQERELTSVKHHELVTEYRMLNREI